MTTSQLSKSRFLFLLVAAIAIVSGAGLSLDSAETPSNRDARNTWLESRASQLIFFAVLEGLYRDGVTNSDVDLIVPPGERGLPTYSKEIFVYACPLCHPAFEAFRLYRQRDPFLD